MNLFMHISPRAWGRGDAADITNHCMCLTMRAWGRGDAADSRPLRAEIAAPRSDPANQSGLDLSTCEMAFASLWDVLAPFCMAEQTFCRKFFFPTDPPQSGPLQQCVSEAIPDFSADVMQLIELADKSNHFAVVTMLNQTEQCMQVYQEQSLYLGGVFSAVLFQLKQTMEAYFMARGDPCHGLTPPSLSGGDAVPGGGHGAGGMQAFVAQMESVIGQGRRLVLERVYVSLAASMFQCLTRVTVDPRTAPIMRMENYRHFSQSLEPTPLVAQSLAKYIQEANQQFTVNLRLYVTAVIRETFGELLTFFEGIDAQLKVIRPQDVHFQPGFERAVFVKVNSWFQAHAERGLRDVHRSLSKQIADQHLVQDVWDGIREPLKERLVTMQQQVQPSGGRGPLRDHPRHD
ncbi:putative exocyst complex component 1 [Paratrimastix pyriformis]|uniref:Exocyst complex component 1 n=1 Tax=Paratrimastix pyriformis TaxID=342808 RepID=A0ABQ8UUS2_9EUKA|nr:putative exocyst complex component 1 [Paratrimastix pyriformis]